MVAHLGLRTHELPFEVIGNIIAEVLAVWEKEVCYEEVANHYQHIFTLIQMVILNERYVKNGWLPQLGGPLNFRSFHQNP